MSQIFFKVYTEAYTSGLVKELGADRWITLEALATYMNENGECWPTQEQIAERIGVSRQAVNGRIKQLLAFRWQGMPILEMRKVRNRRLHSNCLYRVLPTSRLTIFKGVNVSSPPDSKNGNGAV